MTKALRATVLEYLERHNVMTLATGGAEGPWAAAVFYVNDGFVLYFLSAASTRHARDLAADRRVAATIQEDYRDWPEIRGVQLEGTAREVEGADVARVRELYGAKYPLVGDPDRAPGAVAAALASVGWYRIAPTAVYFIDNSVAFGHRSRLTDLG